MSQRHFLIFVILADGSLQILFQHDLGFNMKGLDHIFDRDLDFNLTAQLRPFSRMNENFPVSKRNGVSMS